MHISHTDFLLAALTAPLALQLFIGLSGFGAFTLAATSESLAESQKKVFFKKFAQQISSMGVFLVVYVVLAVAGSAVFLTMKHASAFALWVENPMLSAPLAVALAATAALCIAYRATWQGLKNKALHKLLGFGAVAGSWAVFFVSLAMKLFALKTPPDLAWPIAPSQVLGMARFACFWPLLLQAILLSMACAGAMGLLYLLLRREKDDFGRDYYNFAVKHCAKWALLPSLAQIPAQAWFISTLWGYITTNAGTRDPILMFSGAGLVFIAGACALWAGVIKSQNPLRQKPLMFAGAFCLWAALTGIAAADLYIFL
ncbi:MAG: hypothetical protein SVS15_05165 [Thermodesulfobacteriota bacterium]|nr:hypothetical protein [Thermodesulfobacteriota bacterium]